MRPADELVMTTDPPRPPALTAGDPGDERYLLLGHRDRLQLHLTGSELRVLARCLPGHVPEANILVICLQ
jgi:hypothetical protein